MQFYPTGSGQDAKHYAACLVPAVPPGVVHQIPKHLIEVYAVKLHRCILRHLDHESAAGDALVLRVIVYEAGYEAPEPDLLDLYAIPAGQFKHVVHHPIQPFRVIADDAQQPIAPRPLALLLQQVPGMGDRREWISDFVGDAPPGPPPRGAKSRPGPALPLSDRRKVTLDGPLPARHASSWPASSVEYCSIWSSSGAGRPSSTVNWRFCWRTRPLGSTTSTPS